MEKVREKESKEADEDADRAEEEAKQRAVEEFEKIQMGLEAKSGSGKIIVGREDGKIVVEEELVGKRGEKRKFELDEDELLRIARDERTKARKAIDDEKARLELCCDRIVLTLPRHPKQHSPRSGFHQ